MGRCWCLPPTCFSLQHQHEAALVHAGLTFLCMEEMNGHLETTLLSWPYVRMDGGKTNTKPNSMVRPTYWHVKQNHLSYRSSNCQPPSPHHMGRRPWILSEKYLDYPQGRKLIAHSGQSSWWTLKFTSCFHCFYQPNCFLKYKRH